MYTNCATPAISRLIPMIDGRLSERFLVQPLHRQAPFTLSRPVTSPCPSPSSIFQINTHGIDEAFSYSLMSRILLRFSPDYVPTTPRSLPPLTAIDLWYATEYGGLHNTKRIN